MLDRCEGISTAITCVAASAWKSRCASSSTAADASALHADEHRTVADHQGVAAFQNIGPAPSLHTSKSAPANIG